jgi:hypothetical protein
MSNNNNNNSSSNANNSTGGRGGGRGGKSGSGGRGGGSKKQNGGNFKNKNKVNNSNKEKFKGKCDKLEGFIFDANKYNQADDYIKTVKEIAEYVGAHYEMGADVRQVVEAINDKTTAPALSKPVKPAPPEGSSIVDETDEMIWKKEIDFYVKQKALLESNLRKLFTLI